MLLLNQIISNLHDFLTTSGYYLLDEGAGKSVQVFNAWKDRLLTALQEDFALHAKVNLSFTNTYFELFGDQGATVWSVKAMTAVSETDHGFSFLVKCIICYQKVKAYLTDEGL